MASPSAKASSMFDPEVVEELRRQFKAADADGDGEIDAAEACRLFAQSSSPGASPEEVQRTAESLRQQLDSDKSGKISFDEYCFRFGRRAQMERNRLRRAGTAPAAASTSALPEGNGAPAGGGSGAGSGAGSVEAEREALRRERETLEMEKEREALRREREALAREREQMRQQASGSSAGGGAAASGSAPTAPPPQQSTPELYPGAKVLLQNLRAAELNGKTGSVLRFDAPSGRYVIELHGGGGQKSLRSENLQLCGRPGRQGSGGAASAGGGVSGGGGAAAAPGGAGGPGFVQKAKTVVQDVVAKVTIWLSDYEWWQLALGGAVIVLFVAAYFELGSRYPSSGGAAARAGSGRSAGAGASMGSEGRSTGPRQGGDWSTEDVRGFEDGDAYGGSDDPYQGERQRQSRQGRHSGRRGGYDHDDYDDGYGGGGGGGGLIGMLSGGNSLYFYAIVGGLLYACWKGIIPVHRMSWFQMYMLWNFLEPLLLGGGRRRGGMGGMMGGMGGGFGRRRGFF